MPEYYIKATSNPAPFVGDPTDAYVEAANPEAALLKFITNYKHPMGLFGAWVYASHKASRFREKPLAEVIMPRSDDDG